MTIIQNNGKAPGAIRALFNNIYYKYEIRISSEAADAAVRR